MTQPYYCYTAAELAAMLRVPAPTVRRWAVQDRWAYVPVRPRLYVWADAQRSFLRRRDTPPPTRGA